MSPRCSSPLQSPIARTKGYPFPSATLRQSFLKKNRLNKHGSQSASISLSSLEGDHYLASGFIPCMHQLNCPRVSEADAYAGARSEA